MKKILQVRALLFLAALLLSGIAMAQKPFYMTIEGAAQGNIKGDVTAKGKEGKISGIGYSSTVTSPRDPATGMATGRRTLTGITITKPVDIASTKLYTAMANNENLKNVTLDFYMPNASGLEYKYYSIRLTNAAISRIYQYAGTANPDKSSKYESMVEEITFTFQKIEMTNPTDGSTVVDTWAKP